MWMMSSIRIRSISAPLDRPGLTEPAIDLVRRADAVGLLPGSEPVELLDMTLVRRIAEEASAAGVGLSAAAGILGQPGTDERLASLLRRLDEAMAASPLPEQELRALADVFDVDSLARLSGASAVSLRRYTSGARRVPDVVAERLHWLALVVGDLLGAYNEVGVRRWFERVRTALDGRRPSEVLRGDWGPDDPDVERVRLLAASLAGIGSAA
jgi:uncharacterized protein (DUF2384 family)